MDKQFFFPTILSSTLFDTYLVYGIIGLLILIALIGLFVLLSTSCCCCYCCLSPTSCCHHNRRYSSYRLTEKSKQFESNDPKRGVFLRRFPSDAADFSQLYDSYPHLINNKATTAPPPNLNASCTTINTIVSPISPCSSFRSNVIDGALTNDHQASCPMKNDLNHHSSSQQKPTPIDKPDNVPSSSMKDLCSRPFSYIKNLNDRTQILRRFTPQERSVPVSLDVTRIPSVENDSNQQNHSNIYEAVLPSNSDTTTPIYETEWTHNIRQLMMATSSIQPGGIAVVGLPSIPPDLVPSTRSSSDYFQQQNPYDKFLASRSQTSDSMRRTNMLRRLKDDAAFLY